MLKQLTLSALLFASVEVYALNCTQFSSFKEYGGHWYTVTHDKYTFSQAQEIAEADGGYLAIPDSGEENAYLAGLITRDAAWIGVHDPNFIKNYCNIDEESCINNDSRFRTVKGEPLYYKNWKAGEPNNAVYSSDFLDGKPLVAPVGEYWVIMSAAGQWLDVGNHVQGNSQNARYQAIFEFESMPLCASAPTGSTDPIDQISKPVCDTKIYNADLNITVPHQTFDCQKDPEGRDYCPYMLAECGQEWDYEDGYSQEINATKTVLYDKIRVWAGKIGDNYWGGYCQKYRSTAYFTIEDIEKVLSFELKGAIFDDWIKITLNGHLVKVAPYSGNMLDVVYTDGNKIYATAQECYDNSLSYYCNPVVQYSSSGSTGACELSTSWNQKYSINAKPYLKNGVNKVEIEVIVAGNGEGYAYFEGLAIKGNVNCSGDGCSMEDLGDQEIKEDYTYYNYLCSNGTPIDSGGDCGGDNLIDTDGDGIADSCNSPTPPKNNCRKERFVCLSDAERPCVAVDGKMQCSPFPCIGGDAAQIEDLDTPVGVNDKNNDGWNENGGCSGQIYIFNGQDSRCRSKIALGIVDDCCNHGSFLFSNIDCKDYEQVLDFKKEKGMCHYIGEYCTDKALGACIQKKKTYCCFNSKLARIIAEEGRKQFKSFDWGDAKSPNCRGFTPEEFEKIDFSKIDLTEFSNDVQQQVGGMDIQGKAERLKDKIERMGN